MEYSQYLRTEHWRLLRGAKLQIAPRCEKCDSKKEIEVHHKVYRTSWFDARLPDLQTLCHGCHMLEHAKEWERLPNHLQPKQPPIHVPIREFVPLKSKHYHPKPRVHGPVMPRRIVMNKQRGTGEVPKPINGIYSFSP